MSGWGWNASLALQPRMACKPGGSVSRNIPKLGVDFGAQTTAKDSLNIRWKPECVCKSTEDMKHDWLGWVCIQPKVIRFRDSVNANTSSSSSMVQVSLVERCFGISNVVTMYFSPFGRPSRRPHVSRLRAVFAAAMSKNRVSVSRGRFTVFRSFETGSRLPGAGNIRGA